MIFALPLLIPYAAVGLTLFVIWTLACLMYESVLIRRSPMRTWLVGMGLILFVPLLVFSVAELLTR